MKTQMTSTHSDGSSTHGMSSDFGRSSLPPRLTVVPGHGSSFPQRAPRPSLPPALRAKRMVGTVRAIAARLAKRLPKHVDRDDLVGAGSVGLADAISRRGGMPGVEFEAFAACRIRGAMLDELRRLDALSRSTRRSAKRLSRAKNAVEQKVGRAAFEHEVAAEVGMDVESYRSLRARIEANRAPVLFSALGGDCDDSPHDLVDPSAEAPEALTARAQMAAIVTERVSALPERMRAVIIGLYVDGSTLKEIGVALGVTESRVCQIHAEAIATLRTAFAKTAKTRSR